MDVGTRQELDRLSSAVSALEERVAALEQTQVVRRRPESTTPTPETEGSGGAVSGVFAKLALVCFSLVGALILRVATQQGLVDATAGTAIGLGYCAFLAAGPLLARRAAVVAHGAVLQIAGLVLAPLIVVEMVHRHAVFGVTAASAILLAAGVAGCVLGGVGDRRSLAAVGLFSAAAGVAGLGLDPTGAGARSAAVVALVACGLVSAHVRSWAGVRPAVLVPVLAGVGLGVLVSARRAGVPPSVPATLVGATVDVWALVLANHLVRRARMESGESAWVVVVSIWCGALVQFASPIGASGGALAAGLLLVVGFVMARGRAAGRATVTTAAAAAALAVISFPGLDPTGLGLGFVPLALLAINRSQESDALDIASAIAAVTATATAVPALIALPPVAVLLLSGVLLGAVLLAHWAAPAASTRARPTLAPVSLVAGWALLFLSGRALLFALLGDGDGFHLGVTLELAGFALISQVVGKRLASRTWLVAGVAAIGLVAIKSVFWDLFHLSGAYATGSIVALGVASGVTSFILRRRAA